MQNALDQSSINYNALEAEQRREDRHEMKKALAEVTEFGSKDQLRYYVLSFVADENYEGAKTCLLEWVKAKKAYPAFESKVSPHISYCFDIIHAIKAKREFPGTTKASASKQQDLYDKVVDHFHELGLYLKRLQQIERDTKLADVRSTVIVLKVAFNCVILIASVAFFLEVVQGLGTSFNVVLDAAIKDFTKWFFKVI